jgi:hypothetical protein
MGKDSSSYPSTGRDEPVSTILSQLVGCLSFGGKNMLSKLSYQLGIWARGWLILAVFAAFIIFMVVTLPSVQAVSGGIEGLDTTFFYTPEEAFANIASYPDAGRDVIRNFHVTVDLVNPILYSSFLVLLISWLFRRGLAPESRLQKLNLLPLGAALFDLLENIFIFVMFSIYPARLNFVAWLATTSTMLKILCIYASFVLVLIGLIMMAKNILTKVISAGRTSSVSK